MNTPRRSRFDPTKIAGPFPLLAGFLLVVETLLGFWLFVAENSAERMIAGLLMVLIFAGFLYTVLRVVAEEKKATQGVHPQGLGRVTPAEEQVTEKEIESPQPQQIVGPDRSYVVNRPPESWSTRELTMSEWVAEGLQISDPSVAQRLFERAGEVRDIFVFQAGDSISAIPTPGRTTIDGRKFPTALEVKLLTRLTILPVDRAQPPLFVERPLAHNFLGVVGEFVGLGVLTLQSIGIATGHQQRLVAEFRQEINDVAISQQEGTSLTSNLVLIGIEGELRDHILIMQYSILKGADDPELARDLETLKALVNSFRPVVIPNAEARLRELRDKANDGFMQMMADRGQQIFLTEFGMLLLRIGNLDLDNIDNLRKVIQLLKPFETFAQEVGLQDDMLAALWGSLREAERGDASDMKDIMRELVEVLEDQGQEPEGLPLGQQNDDIVSAE